MREIEIDIDETKSPKSIFDRLKMENPKKGDHLKLLGSKESQSGVLLFVLVVILLYLSRSAKSFGETVIEKVFGKYESEEELEAEIEKEYGIKVTVEPKHDPEREDWMRFASAQFERGYTDADDLYDQLPVKEPNPKYVPWKKEK